MQINNIDFFYVEISNKFFKKNTQLLSRIMSSKCEIFKLGVVGKLKCFYVSAIFIFFISNILQAQIKGGLSDADKSALEGIIVEKYYTADAKDAADTIGGFLPIGSVTYRIYADLKPGYTLQAVYGVPTHELRIETTTEFFNNKYGGSLTGDLIDPKKINDNSVALDSWVTLGAATKSHFGIPKADDKDGSILKRKSLNKADGLIAGKVSPVTFFGMDLSFFQSQKKVNLFSTKNASWAVFGGVKGPTPDNKILIAQLTTNGKLSFELNIQIGTPKGATVQYVAKDPENAEIKFDALTY